MTAWSIQATELANCNCAYGCPCQFSSLPTNGSCEAAAGIEIKKGHYGDTNLDGTRAAMVVKWPGPIHEGNGEMQIIIDESASADQRAALQAIMTGEDTDEMATMFWVYSAMTPTKHETLYKNIDMKIDVDAREGKMSIPGVVEIEARPIPNIVSGEPHRARLNLPHGFEYDVAEFASGSTKTTGGAIDLPNNTDSHAHLAKLHMTGSGVVRQ
jgi:hypothetical protein